LVGAGKEEEEEEEDFFVAELLCGGVVLSDVKTVGRGMMMGAG
jgi:hypothetical protein